MSCKQIFKIFRTTLQAWVFLNSCFPLLKSGNIFGSQAHRFPIYLCLVFKSEVSRLYLLLFVNVALSLSFFFFFLVSSWFHIPILPYISAWANFLRGSDTEPSSFLEGLSELCVSFLCDFVCLFQQGCTSLLTLCSEISVVCGSLCCSATWILG